MGGMFVFVIGLLLILVSTAVAMFGAAFEMTKAIRVVASVFLLTLGMTAITVSTAIFVEDNQGGVVVRKFGNDLEAGRIIATNGEKGPQASVLPPGWHFGYFPWLYDLETVDNIDIPQGKLGIVTAKDGKPLAYGEVFAEAWESPEKMLDGQTFLTTAGQRGPQLTVLSPGQYRYNPRLFEISLQPLLEVPVGSVAVIKANAGPKYSGDNVEMVNGVPIVPNGYRGIWREPLTPNAYYLHPSAYVVTTVETTNRVYNYTSERQDIKKDNSIEVRSKDGFEFPVDVRVSVKISAEEAPYVVARLANPDNDSDNDGFNVLEERVILPLIRAIFRNSAETRSALEYVNSRSEVEKAATKLLQEGLAEFRVETDGVYVADIGLSDTEQGKKLLLTQTEKEIASQEVETHAQKKLAENARADAVKAATEADQEAPKAEARAKVDIAKSEAEAEIELARGKAEGYKKVIEAMMSEGSEKFLSLEVTKLLMSKWTGALPEIMLTGSSDNSGVDAMIAKMLQQQVLGRNMPANAVDALPNK